MEKRISRSWLMNKRGSKTHQQIADMAEISRSYYTEIEIGSKDPSVSVAKRISKALGFNWVLFFENECCEKQHDELSQTGTD